MYIKRNLSSALWAKSVLSTDGSCCPPAYPGFMINKKIEEIPAPSHFRAAIMSYSLRQPQQAMMVDCHRGFESRLGQPRCFAAALLPVEIKVSDDSLLCVKSCESWYAGIWSAMQRYGSQSVKTRAKAEKQRWLVGVQHPCLWPCSVGNDRKNQKKQGRPTSRTNLGREGEILNVRLELMNKSKNVKLHRPQVTPESFHC